MNNYFTIFGLEIYFYAVIIVSGMILGAVVAYILCKRRGLNPEIVIDMLLWIIPLAIVGARLYYVLSSPREFSSFKDIINIRSGGMAIYGGIIGGAIAVMIVSRYKKIKFIHFADIAVVGLILGQAIGRWGNYVNQEVYGQIVTNPKHFGLPWSVNIDGVYHQATFFYESMWNVLGFVLLFIAAWKYRNKIDGLIMCAYFIWYGIGRFVIEGMRMKEYILFIGETNIPVSQAVSIALILLGLGLGAFFIYRNKKISKDTNKEIKE